jgi:hypothetical protein
MKSFLLWSVSIAFLFFTSLQSTYSETIIPGGYVSGTWTAAGSPYLIQGDITVHTDSTLNIQPGVEVNFQGHYTLTVNGFLQAVGTETDSILFTGTSWLGITFENAPDSSHLTYCIVRDVGMLFLSHGGITCMNSNPVISHSRISNNQGQGEWGAGGIMLYNNSNANISRCNISDNSIYHDFGGSGGGIKIRDSHPTITGCTISDNYGDGRGGGIDMLGSSSLDISNCTITGNVLSPYELAFDNAGGGIASQGSDLTVTQCTISYNVGGNYGGGGIWISGGDAMITYCTINNNNTAPAPALNTAGGGIYADCDTLAVDHCTFVDNLVGDPTNFVGFSIHAEGSTSLILKNSIVKGRGFPDRLVGLFGASASITYSDFYLYRDAFVGNLPTGLGELTQVNANGDSCDVYSNIFMDPLFADAVNGDYHLTWANWPTPDSTKSPCIDAGDPASPKDPDSTVADMGAFSFDQGVPVELVSFTAGLNGDEEVILEWITATEKNNSGFEIERKQDNSGWDKIGFVEGHGTTTEPNTYYYSDDISNIIGKSVTYRLKQIDYNGSHQYSNEVSVEISIPMEFKLYQNYPNPFNLATAIQYSIPLRSNVILKVYDILGTEVTTLVNEEKEQGVYTINFDANNLASGLYLYRIQAGSFIDTRKMILLK